MHEKNITIDPYKILKSLVEITSSHSGKDYLKTICLELKKLFNADIVFITQAIELNPTYNVKVLYSTLDSFAKEFNLDNTPCQLVFDNKVIKIDEDVSLNFKKDKKFEMESFLGIPMINEDEICFGHIAIMSEKKKAFFEEHIEIAKIFLGRIELEAKRQLLEEENEKIKNELYILSITDSLTNLYNRRYFIQKANEIFSLVKRDISKASMITFDIDNFKTINDNYGHDEGDYVLKELGTLLNKNSRDGVDFIFRIGGEEFAIISINNSTKEIKEYTKRLMKKTKEAFDSKSYKVTFSVGISPLKKEFETWQEAYTISDKRMYLAKTTGKNKIVSKN